MDYIRIIPIIFFTLSMSITPGPNNIMLTASGANFGFRKTIPHLSGIWFGMTSLLILSAFGLKKIFDLYPLLKTILKFAGIGYMMFLAWKIVGSRGGVKGGGSSKPISFFQAALFQIVNPKAVMMAITAISVYTVNGDLYFSTTFIVIILFLLTGFPSTALWAAFGTAIGSKLQDEKKRKIFNLSLGGLTACSALLLLF